MTLRTCALLVLSLTSCSSSSEPENVADSGASADLGVSDGGIDATTDTGPSVDASTDSGLDSFLETTSDATSSFTLSSSSFPTDGPIMVTYTCRGENISPALAWSGAPSATKSYALIVDDPDAPGGTFVHWVVYDIPRTTLAIAEKETAGVSGTNGFGQMKWNGPCPPAGKAHRYMFKLTALDVETIGLAAGATKDKVEAAMKGHVLGLATLMGSFQTK